MQVEQRGERPRPAKRSEQPVLSLGAKAVRRGLSVGRGAQEPQCESVKRNSPVSYKERKPIPSSGSQAAMQGRKRESEQVPSGSQARGECVKGILAYLGGLAGSEKVRGIEVLKMERP